MRKARASGRIPKVLLLFAGVAATPLAAQEPPTVTPTVTPAFDTGEWVAGDRPLELRLSRPLRPDEGRIAVLVGSSDVSALLVTTGQRVLYHPRGVPLPAGEVELAVFLVDARGRWLELDRHPIRVLTSAGFERAELSPRVELRNAGQLAESHFPEESAPLRPTYQEFTLGAGLTTLHSRDGWEIRSQSNFVGVSEREQALRFGARGEEAPLLDLSDYRVTVERGLATLSLGHVSFGASPHLINGFGSRGLSAALDLGGRGQAGVALLNGTSMVGWGNPFGLANPAHRIAAAGVALDLLPGGAGTLRIRGSLLDGSVLPRTGFTQGGIVDAEESRGLGVVVEGSDASRRLRFEAGFTRSDFTNPDEPTLSQGASLVPVESTARNARYLDASYELLRGMLIADVPLSLTAAVRHEAVDPLFRSVAAYSRADLLQNSVELRGSLGQLMFQLRHARSNDNLDDIASILTTLTRSTSLNLAVPGSWLVRVESSPWLPMLSYGLHRDRQFGEGVPVNGGFSPGHVPDQVSMNHSLALDWQGGIWRAGYQLNRTLQDNRQPGRETADFGHFTHNVAVGVSPGSTLDLSLDLGFENSENEEFDEHGRTRRIGVSAGWRPWSRTGLVASASRTRGEEVERQTLSGATDLNLELSQSFTVFRRTGGESTGQAFIRFGRMTGELSSPDFEDLRRSWTLNTGLSLNLF